MPYVSGFDRDQLMCCSWDTFVDKESIARIIDAFVNHLDIKKYGVKAVSEQGRPSYNPIRLTSIMASQAENESRSDNIRRGQIAVNYQKEVCIQDENRRWSVWQQRIRICYFLH